MEKLVINEEKVKKLLLNLNENKSMGPDELHPKLLKFLSGDNNFIAVLTLLLNECIVKNPYQKSGKVQWLYQYIRRDLFISRKTIDLSH